MRTKYELAPKELSEIEKAIRQAKRAEVRQRATAIRLLHLGYKPEVVAEQQMVSVPTIYNWHKHWRESGIEGLTNKARKGRKPKANEAYSAKLKEMLEKEPSAYGWNNDTIDWQVADWKNSQTFIQFIEYLLLERYPTGRIILVMDNVSYHKSAAVLAALSLF